MPDDLRCRLNDPACLKHDTFNKKCLVTSLPLKPGVPVSPSAPASPWKQATWIYTPAQLQKYFYSTKCKRWHQQREALDTGHYCHFPLQGESQSFPWNLKELEAWEKVFPELVFTENAAFSLVFIFSLPFPPFRHWDQRYQGSPERPKRIIKMTGQRSTNPIIRSSQLLCINSISHYAFVLELPARAISTMLYNIGLRATSLQILPNPEFSLVLGQPHYRAFSLTWSMNMFLKQNKRKRLHKNKVQFPED